MQGVHGPEPLAFDIGSQGPQCRIGMATALLRPGHEERLQQLRHALARQRMKPLFGRIPVARPRLDIAKQQLGRLAVRKFLREPDGFGSAAHEASQKCLLGDFQIARIGGQRPQKLIGRVLGIRLADGEASGQVFAERSCRHDFRGSPAARGL